MVLDGLGLSPLYAAEEAICMRGGVKSDREFPE